MSPLGHSVSYWQSRDWNSVLPGFQEVGQRLGSCFTLRKQDSQGLGQEGGPMHQEHSPKAVE